MMSLDITNFRLIIVFISSVGRPVNNACVRLARFTYFSTDYFESFAMVYLSGLIELDRI